MSDVRAVKAKSTAFTDHGDGTGVYTYSLEDGTCLRVQITLTQGALHLEDLSRAIANQIRKQAKG